MKVLPIHLFAPAPIKRIVEGGEVMKGIWGIEQGSWQASVAMKVDVHDHIYSRTCTVTKDFRRRLQPVVAGARLRGEVIKDWEDVSNRRLRAHGSEEKSDKEDEL